MENFVGKVERASYQRQDKKIKLIQAYHQVCNSKIEEAIKDKEAEIGEGKPPLSCRMRIHSYTKHTTFVHPAWWEGCNNIVTQVSICRRKGCKEGKVTDITDYYDDW